MGNSAEPFLQPCIVEPQMMRDGIHSVFPGKFDCGLPHRIRQFLSPWSGATNLIQLELCDWLGNHTAFMQLALGRSSASTNLTGRVSGRHACLPKTHALTASQRQVLQPKMPSQWPSHLRQNISDADCRVQIVFWNVTRPYALR